MLANEGGAGSWGGALVGAAGVVWTQGQIRPWVALRRGLARGAEGARVVSAGGFEVMCMLLVRMGGHCDQV